MQGTARIEGLPGKSAIHYGMELVHFVRALEELLPPDTAMEGDRIGLQLQSGRDHISSVLVTMEITEEVVLEAVENNCDCIVAFHPLIFAPLTSLRDNERVGRLCTQLIQHSIALVVAHTNFDAFPRGTSTLLAERLGLSVQCRLVDDPVRKDFGMGVIAEPDVPLAAGELLDRLYAVCNSPLRYTSGVDTPIQRIAIVGGSGASFISKALAAKVDAFITADVKYHDFHRVRGTMWLIDPGHYEMEQFVAGGLAHIITEILRPTAVAVRCSRVLPNPVLYYPGTDTYKHAQQEYLTV